MEEVFLRGWKGVFKRLFLECHGQGGLIVCKGRGVWVSVFFLLSSKVLTQHWPLASFDETLSYQSSY
jgi:hypothetical protein